VPRMRDLEHVLVRLKDWEQFEAVAGSLDPKGQGDLFELLTKHYLLINPAYRTVLSDVWLLDEVPAKVRHELRLPDRDKGIDLIARTRVGGYWAIQSKYCSAAEGSLTWREISTFAGLAFSVCIGIEFGLIAYTGERYTDVFDEAQHVGFLSRDVWSTLAEEFFDDLSSALAGKRRTLIARDPRPHQRCAIENAKTYFE
jgi:predicted helicase